MEYVCNKNDCVGCLNCLNLCKFSAIELFKDKLGFVYPKINETKCKHCNVCKIKCPVLNRKNIKTKNYSNYACINKNETTRKNSSSGGVFSLIAENIILKKGVVYGAGYDSDFNVIHKRIDNIFSIKELMGSKYVQSNLKDIFKKVKRDLDNGTLVLFTGTPCQIAAIKIYLNKEYDNLYLQDFICHGVGSKLILDIHIQKIKEKYGLKDICDINFRDKISGWKKFSFSISTYEEKYCKTIDKDEYMKTFLKNLCLRESCYKCKFKGDRRISDITLADFWGIEKIDENLDDDLGVSAVILNTIKGIEIFDSIKDKMIVKLVKYTDISSNNICLENPPIYNNHRNEFIKDIMNGIELSELNENYYRRDVDYEKNN